MNCLRMATLALACLPLIAASDNQPPRVRIADLGLELRRGDEQPVVHRLRVRDDVSQAGHLRCRVMDSSNADLLPMARIAVRQRQSRPQQPWHLLIDPVAGEVGSSIVTVAVADEAGNVARTRFQVVVAAGGFDPAWQEPAAGGGNKPVIRITASQFGAIPDDGLDDTDAFAAAATAINQAGGGTLIIPPGRYLVGRELTTAEKEASGEPLPYYRCHPLLAFGPEVRGLRIFAAGAVLQYADGLHYGAFDAEGEPYHHPIGTNFADRDYAANPGPIITFDRCRDVLIHGLELDGNSAGLIVGGRYGGDDDGIQLAAHGIATYSSERVVIEDVLTHDHGLDGLYVTIGGLFRDRDGTTYVTSQNWDSDLAAAIPHSLVDVLSDRNGRQGMSITGGRSLYALRCRFERTGRGAIASPPMAGLDIEPNQPRDFRDARFVDCAFVDNAGVGMVCNRPDQVDDIVFDRCLFWGTTNWSAWTAAPGFTYRDSTFHGAVVHAWGDDDPERATRFLGCRFEDVTADHFGRTLPSFGGNGELATVRVKTSFCNDENDNTYGYIAAEQADDNRNVRFEGCTFRTNAVNAFTFQGGVELIGSRVEFGHLGEPTGIAHLAFCTVADTVFSQDYADDVTAIKRILGGTTCNIGEGVVVEPRDGHQVVRWQEIDVLGTKRDLTGPIPPHPGLPPLQPEACVACQANN